MDARGLLDWMGEREREVLDNPLPFKEIRAILKKGSSDELRAVVQAYYKKRYDNHVVVEALGNPSVSYYRIDSMRVAQYTAFTLGSPTLLFLPAFQDDPPSESAGRWRSAEEKFWDYFGCDMEGFVRAVEAGAFLVTVGPESLYRGPFMRDLLDLLARVPEKCRPVYANVLQTSFAATESGRPSAEARKKLERILNGKSRDNPLLKEHTITIAGEPSLLDPVVPAKYLKERFEWFDAVLPPSLWSLVETEFNAACGQPASHLAPCMNLTFVLNNIFGSPVYYARGCTLRVCSDDLLNWKETLEGYRAAQMAGVSRVTTHSSRIRHGSSVLGGLGSAVSHGWAHLPNVVHGVEERFSRRIPAVFRGREFAHFVTQLERWTTGSRSNIEAEREVKEKLQTTMIRKGSQLKEAEAVVLAKEVDECLRSNAELVERFRWARRDRVLAYLGLGATAAGIIFPSASALLRLFRVGADKALGVATERAAEGAMKEINPNFQIRLELADGVRSLRDA